MNLNRALSLIRNRNGVLKELEVLAKAVKTVAIISVYWALIIRFRFFKQRLEPRLAS